MCFLWNTGCFYDSWKMTYYNNPLLVISAVALFLFVKNYHFANDRINSYAKSAFSIYLVQSSMIGSRIVYGWVKSHAVDWGANIWWMVILIAVIILTGSLIFDGLRIRLFKKLGF